MANHFAIFVDGNGARYLLDAGHALSPAYVADVLAEHAWVRVRGPLYEEGWEARHVSLRSSAVTAYWLLENPPGGAR